MCDLEGCGNQADLPPIKVDPEQRRLFLKGLAALPIATVLAYPDLASATAERLETTTLTLSDGSTASAALALPDADNAPAVLLIHEWWGLNDQIKAVAAELAKQGYIALAVDLYGGEAATTPDGAKALMSAVNPDKATATLASWVEWLHTHKQSNGKVATLGWCFGGGWSLKASVAATVDATVIYYGDVTTPTSDLKKLVGPVMGHFGTEDARINEAMVSGFEANMAEAGKASDLTVYWYEADHAFANPTGARYDAEDAALSWDRTMSFLKHNLATRG